MATQPNELKRVRKALGLSQAEMAARLGISQGYIGELERGEKAMEHRVSLQINHLDALQRMIDDFCRCYETDIDAAYRLRNGDFHLHHNGEDISEAHALELEIRATEMDARIKKAVADFGLFDRRKAT
ncbi:helix-turn-helix domain-containing protein [Rhizorhabdus sp.]|uniref:helix-turn-helix domain-containing protein n=1 Tax=Rhizorhabdus sp. TaxID=1968843 RepID=UPI0035B0D7F6